MSKLLNIAFPESDLQSNGLPIMRGKRMSDMKLKNYDWLWPNMICRGKVHTLAGDAGIGKTMIQCNIASIVSRGGYFPGETEPCKKETVLYLSGEDGDEDTLLPRVKACSGDLNKVISLPQTVRGDFFSILDHAEELEATIEEYKDVGLLFIDPITAFCGRNFQNNSATDVRLVMSALAQISDRTNVAIIALTHLRKDRTGGMLNRLLGAGAWTHGARVVFGVMQSERHGVNLLGKLKTNICEDVGCYPYTIRTKEMSGRTQEVAYADWVDGGMWHERMDVMEREEGDSETSHYGEKKDLACTIISEVLADGKPHPISEIENQCSDQNISLATMKIAGAFLNVNKERTKTTPSTGLWSLPSRTPF